MESPTLAGDAPDRPSSQPGHRRARRGLEAGRTGAVGGSIGESPGNRMAAHPADWTDGHLGYKRFVILIQMKAHSNLHSNTFKHTHTILRDIIS